MQRTKNVFFHVLLAAVLIASISAFNKAPLPGNSSNYTLSPAGDVNGDGYADVMISIYNNEFGVSSDGNVQLFWEQVMVSVTSQPGPGKEKADPILVNPSLLRGM